MARSVLVTGGNRGIGLAIARALAADGDKVAVTYRPGEPPAGALRRALRGDRHRLGRRGVHRGRGRARPGRGARRQRRRHARPLLMRMSDDDFDAVLDANLTGAFRCARRASKGMIRLRRGRIVLHLQRGRAVRLGRPGQLRGVQVRPRRAGPLGDPRARRPRDHRQRRRAGLHRDRHDGARCPRTRRRPTSRRSRPGRFARRTRSRTWCGSSRRTPRRTSAVR